MTRVGHAMVLAAGLGQRMRPLTNDKPKALVVLQGQTLLDRALVKCREADVDTLVVNTHYKGEMIVHHVRDWQTSRSRRRKIFWKPAVASPMPYRYWVHAHSSSSTAIPFGRTAKGPRCSE